MAVVCDSRRRFPCRCHRRGQDWLFHRNFLGWDRGCADLDIARLPLRSVAPHDDRCVPPIDLAALWGRRAFAARDRARWLKQSQGELVESSRGKKLGVHEFVRAMLVLRCGSVSSEFCGLLTCLSDGGRACLSAQRVPIRAIRAYVRPSPRGSGLRPPSTHLVSPDRPARALLRANSSRYGPGEAVSTSS